MRGSSLADLWVQGCCPASHIACFEHPQKLRISLLGSARARIWNNPCKARGCSISTTAAFPGITSWMVISLQNHTPVVSHVFLTAQSIGFFKSLKIRCDHCWYYMKIQVTEAHWSVFKYQRLSKQLFKSYWTLVNPAHSTWHHMQRVLSHASALRRSGGQALKGRE